MQIHINESHSLFVDDYWGTPSNDEKEAKMKQDYLNSIIDEIMIKERKKQRYGVRKVKS